MDSIDARVCNVERLKKVLDFDNIDRTDFFNVVDLMEKAKCKLRYVSSGSIGHVYETVPDEDGDKKNVFAIKVAPYKKREWLEKYFGRYSDDESSCSTTTNSVDTSDLMRIMTSSTCSSVSNEDNDNKSTCSNVSSNESDESDKNNENFRSKTGCVSEEINWLIQKFEENKEQKESNDNYDNNEPIKRISNIEPLSFYEYFDEDLTNYLLPMTEKSENKKKYGSPVTLDDLNSTVTNSKNNEDTNDESISNKPIDTTSTSNGSIFTKSISVSENDNESTDDESVNSVMSKPSSISNNDNNEDDNESTDDESVDSITSKSLVVDDDGEDNKSMDSVSKYLTINDDDSTWSNCSTQSSSSAIVEVVRKVGPTNGTMSIYDKYRDINAEFRILNLLNYLVIDHKTPHIILPIEKFYTNTSMFVDGEDIGIDNRNYKRFSKRPEDYEDLCSVIFMEYCPLGTIDHFIKENYEKLDSNFWKVTFFQLLSVFATIQTKYPTFRHNDLKLNNVLITEDKSEKSDYEINGKKYSVKSSGYSIMLYDFDFSSIDGVVNNHKVKLSWVNDIGICPDEDHYFDIHFFFNCLYRDYWFGKDIWNDKYVPKDTLDFVARVVPEEYRKGKNVTDKGRILNGIKHTSSLELLENDEYFAEFRVD